MLNNTANPLFDEDTGSTNVSPDYAIAHASHWQWTGLDKKGLRLFTPFFTNLTAVAEHGPFTTKAVGYTSERVWRLLESLLPTMEHKVDGRVVRHTHALYHDPRLVKLTSTRADNTTVAHIASEINSIREEQDGSFRFELVVYAMQKNDAGERYATGQKEIVCYSTPAELQELHPDFLARYRAAEQIGLSGPRLSAYIFPSLLKTRPEYVYNVLSMRC